MTTGLAVAPVVFVDVALAARAEAGMRVRGAGRSWGVERWEVGGSGSAVGGAGVAGGVGSLAAVAVEEEEEEGLVSGTGAEVKIGGG